MSHNPLSVLVLHEVVGVDAPADAQDTLVQAGQVAEALQACGYQVSTLTTDLNLDATLAEIRRRTPDCVFNLVESLGGVGSLIHLVPAVLSSANISYTGADADSMYLSSHKLVAKNLMRQQGIATAASFSAQDQTPMLVGSWIVKSLWEHASHGLDDASVVPDVGAARERIAACQETYGGQWFAEQFIDGREFNVSVLECAGAPRVLPIAEIEFIDFAPNKPKIVGYAAKWDEAASEYQATRRVFPQLNSRLQAQIEAQVLQCWQAFGLRGYARVDIRCDAAGKPWVLEVNANPCLAQDAGFVAAAQLAGIDYQQVIHHILQSALQPVDRLTPQLESDKPANRKVATA